MERGKLTEFESELRDSIAINLKRLLKERDFSQRQLSEKTGIPTSTISDYLNAKSLAVPGNVQKMALALGVQKQDIDPSFHNDSSRKESRDIARDLEKILADLEDKSSLAFYGEEIELDEDARELLKISLEQSMRLAKQMAKKKFTPNKYKK